MTLQEVDDLESRIHGLQLPRSPFQLFPGTSIADVEEFLKSSFAILRHNPQGVVAEAIIYRINKFIEMVEEMQ